MLLHSWSPVDDAKQGNLMEQDGLKVRDSGRQMFPGADECSGNE